MYKRQSQHQLLALLKDASERKLIDINALSIIESVLGYSELHARDVMIPRGQMVVIDGDLTIMQAMPTIVDSAHSRFPVIDQNKDQVLGILLAKDLLPLFIDNKANMSLIEHLVRPVSMVPESKRLDSLLKDFQKKRTHMAIVIDEFGGVSGLITIEDILEQIVGDIVDETDIEDNEPNIKTVNENEYHIKALTPIEEINEQFNLSFEDEKYDTLAGLIISNLGYLPRIKEQFELPPLTITVISGSSRRLKELRVIYNP